MKRTVSRLLAALAIASFSTVALAEQPPDNGDQKGPAEQAQAGKATPAGPQSDNANGGIGNAYGQGGGCLVAC